MLTPEQIFGFLLAAVAITAAPGPDNLMVLGMGMSKGRLQGAVFGLGCALGCLSHTVLAVLGVSALIAASPVAFTLLRIVGGAYLVWLGVQSLRSRGGVRAADSGQPDAALGPDTGADRRRHGCRCRLEFAQLHLARSGRR